MSTVGAGSLAGAESPEPRGENRVVLRIALGNHAGQVTFASTTALAASGDLELAVSLLPAMRFGDPLRIGSPVSRRLLGALPRLQEFHHSCDRHEPCVERRYGLRPIPVEAEAIVPPCPDRGVATFFTGGVDSLYTTLKHRDEISGLVFVEGFDLDIDAASHELRTRVLEEVRASAAVLGLPLVEVWTDLRWLSDNFLRWGDYNGSALAAVSFLLRGSFAKLYVPATLTYGSLRPLGSHPVTDPLWSTEDVEIVHDGCEANRLEKLRSIAQRVPALLRNLRVCLLNPDGAYNCGACEKCVRTMTALRLAGASALCSTLPVLETAAFEDISPPDNRSTWDQLLAAAEEDDREPELAEALRRFLADDRL